MPIRIALILAAVFPALIQTTPESSPSEKILLPEAVRGWDPTEAPASTETLYSLKAGVDYYDNKQYASALEALPGAAEAGTAEMGDYVLLYRAKSEFMMEQYGQALDDFRLLIDRYADSPLIDDALVGQSQAFLHLKDYQSALAVLNGRKMEGDTEALFHRARAMEESGEKEQAAALYLQIYSQDPTSEFSELSERYLQFLSPEALRGKSSYGIRLRRAESLLEANDTGGARTLLLALGKTSAPNTESSQKRILLLADAEYRGGNTSSALSHLRKITGANPSFQSRALYLEGACCRRLKREKTLMELLEKALKLYPDSPDTEELCYTVATYFELNYRSAEAREAYRVLYRRFPKGRRSEAVLWKLALFSFLDKQYGDAVLEYWDYMLSFPDPLSAGSAMYWMGRCYEKLGDAGKARYLYGRAREIAGASYYGQRAREAEAALKRSQTGKRETVPEPDFKRVTAFCDGIRFASARMPEPSRAATRVIERARRLAHVDLTDLALSELRWGIRQYPDSEIALRYIMSRVYESRGDYYESIVSLRRAFPDYYGRPIESLPDRVWKLLFPVRHWEIVSAQAAKSELDPHLILGLIRQESAFEERANSSAGARGLMQILPTTGRMLANQARLPRYSSGKLFQAETNLTLGIRHLAALLQQYEKLELALSAYNAGETRVKKWIQEFGDTDMAEFVEQIPFSETRNYVKRVLGNKAYYDLLISSPQSSVRRETE